MTVPSGRAYIYKSTGDSFFSWETDYRLKKSLGKYDVLIRVMASGLNPLDYKVPSMLPFWMALKGKPVGHDVLGTVMSVGSKVTDLKEGDVVFGNAPALCDYTIASYDHIAKVPGSISEITPFGGLCVVGCTAIQMLRKAKAFDGSGKMIMIIGASGGVGSMAVQIARAKCPVGTQIIAVSSARSAEYVKSIGADTVIDYTADGFRFGSCVESKSIDVIIDCVSSPDDYDYVPEGMGLIKEGSGEYVACITARNSQWVKSGLETFTGFRFFRGQYHLIMVQSNSADLMELANLVEAGKLSLHVDEYFSFDAQAIQTALEKLSKRHVRGKLIVKH